MRLPASSAQMLKRMAKNGPSSQVKKPPTVVMRTGSEYQVKLGPSGAIAAFAWSVVGAALKPISINSPNPVPQPRMPTRKSRRVLRYTLVNQNRERGILIALGVVASALLADTTGLLCS